MAEMQTKPAAEAPRLITLTEDQFDRLLAKAGGAGDDATFAKQLAEAHRQAIRPENSMAPGISVFNPLGERDHPNPQLTCKTYQNGIELEHESLTREELTLFNRLAPGDYLVTKSDLTRVPFLVREERDGNGRLQKRHVTFPCKELEDRMGLPGTVDMLREVLGEALSPADVAALREKNQRLEAQLAARGAAVA